MKNGMDIKFGTDGWRAVIAREFTFDNVRIVAQAISDYMNNSRIRYGMPKVVVGFDRRFMSDIYARIISEVLAANKIKVLHTVCPTPTPAVSFAIKDKQLDGGVIVTASHNPFMFNGIKFKTRFANSADETVTKHIESFLGKQRPVSLDMNKAQKQSLIQLFDAGDAYRSFLKTYVDISKIKKVGFKVLIDYMFGAGIGYIEEILSAPKNIHAVRNTNDPLFGNINPEPIPKNLKLSSDYVKKNRFDLCVALDGDADRVGAIRPDGEFITSGQIVSLILLHFLENRKLRGAVVKTISGTTLIEKICDRHNLTMYETPVGFKYISALMLKENILIGGEESGGIGFCGYIPERDGILSSLLLMEMLSCRGKSIDRVMRDMDREYGCFSYDRIDMEYPADKAVRLTKRLKEKPPVTIAGKKVMRIKTYDGIKFILNDSSWLLLRFSGTEPLIRIYAEAGSKKRVKALLEAGRDIIK